MKTIQKKHTNANADLELTDFAKLYELMSQRDVAEKMGITQAAVSFLEKKALKKVRQRLALRRIYNMDGIV